MPPVCPWTYDEWEKSFRIQDYHPYSNVEEWAETLMTKRYSNLDNPTGIYVEAGDSVIVLVGDTHGQSLSIQCIGEEKSGDYVQTADFLVARQLRLQDLKEPFNLVFCKDRHIYRQIVRK